MAEDLKKDNEKLGTVISGSLTGGVEVKLDPADRKSVV